MVHDIEHLQAKLDVEVFGDLGDAIVLEHGKIQAGDAGANQNVAAGIAAEIEAT